MTGLWGLAAAAALVWPGRLSGPLDGAPLDNAIEAMAIGLLFPALWWFHPRFLRLRAARAATAALLAWKAFTAVALVQDGWCVRIVPARPYFADAAGAPHSWDVRADWRALDPACSAIMTRPYRELHEFPVWFFNLPPPNESWPERDDRPPGARLAMTVQGFLHTSRDGLLRIDAGPDLAAAMRIDGGAAQGEARVASGSHAVVINATMTGERWALIPLIDNVNLWARATRRRR